jgi:hypothetical protein
LYQLQLTNQILPSFIQTNKMNTWQDPCKSTSNYPNRVMLSSYWQSRPPRPAESSTEITIPVALLHWTYHCAHTTK